jgi:PAS domain-containing protein
MLSLAETALIFGAGLSAALIAQLAGPGAGAAPQSAGPPGPPEEDPVALLFDGESLHHASDSARANLALDPTLHDWQDLRRALEGDFPELPDSAAEAEGLTLEAPGRRLEVTRQGAMRLVLLLGPEESGPQATVLLNRLSETAPHPAWEEDETGQITWHNQAYTRLAARLDRPDGARLFPTPDPGGADQTTVLREGGEGSLTFSLDASEADGRLMCHATNIDAQIAAEAARLTFMQTLGKTFAHLPTGLAIFDRHGRLALFNPSLVDLTQLQPVFLSSKPDILGFFDQLRENRRMPEPKNYADWRRGIADLLRRASGEGYHDTWSLADGRTFRVQGRPQPDGATAFLIDDITSEVVMTRSFRRELEIGQGLLDVIEDAIAVFSRGGVLTFSNARYRRLWKQDPEAAFADVTIRDCLDLWQGRWPELAAWPTLEPFVNALEDPDPAHFDLPEPSGGAIELRAIAPGARMVRFRGVEPLGISPPDATAAAPAGA